MRTIDLTNKTFGNLTVLRRVGKKGREITWVVRCVCGTTKVVRGLDLRRGHTWSCGRHRTRLMDPVAEKARISEQRRQYRTRPEVLLYMLYRKEVERSSRDNWPMPAYTFEEFRDHWIRHPSFVRRYAEWKASGYKNRWLRPSVDRINASKPYTFQNTQMLNWGENRYKLNLERRIFGSRLSRRGLKVVQTKDGVVVAEYATQSEAVRKTGFPQAQISAVIGGRFKTTHGYKFEYRAEEGRISS